MNNDLIERLKEGAIGITDPAKMVWITKGELDEIIAALSPALPEEVQAQIAELEKDVAFAEKQWRSAAKSHKTALTQIAEYEKALEKIRDYMPRGGLKHLLQKQAAADLERIRGMK